MSASFRDGMAFCAIIHKHRPDLIDFDSLSKHNVYDNNRLAFETAESELGIPALLDPEDMVSMKVPDRLSIITYVSQYYNYFTNKSQATRPSLKIPGRTVQNKLAINSNDQVPESKKSTDDQSKCKALSSTCAACQKHVHLVQRHFVDGKLYHRNCFRCAECSSTLIPGSYKVGTPRTRPPRVKDSPIINGDPVAGVCAGDPGNPGDPSRTTPAPAERSLSPGSSSQSCGAHKPRDPPWMALVHPGPWRKLPPAPPTHMTSLPRSGTVPSLSGWGSRLPASTNPFETEEKADEEAGEEAGPVSGLGPPSVVAKHPWYGISGAAKAASVDSPTRAASAASPADKVSQTHAASTANKGSPTHAASPANRVSQNHAASASPADSVNSTRTAHSSSPKSKKRRAPAVPQSSSTDCSYSKSLSIPSLPSALSAPTEVGASPPAPSQFKRACKKNPFNQKASPSYTSPKSSSCEGPRSTRPQAPGHGFPLIKRKVQSDQFVPVEDIQMEMAELERQLDQLELRGVELERRLRHCQDGEEEDTMLVDWFTLIHEKHMLVRREAELVYTAKQQNLEERQADVEYELRCLLNKPETEWIKDDRDREQQLMIELVTIIEERNQIINSMDQEKQREEVEDKLLAAMIKRKDFHKETDSAQRKRAGVFKALKVLKMLSHKTERGKRGSHHKGKR
ncbi:hypothetical protein MATL_G00217010 [Megalops atlanticus]|uniref:MICAL-like protein 1 n=1 Tax=Megalops atlanticus TaxID=7932 RepID=A0A9D3T3R8_MEGAT|nr:hypothetical protein MATL_G00217010 [Megalops atlanticus]